jgi:hypothetical protein
MDPGNFLEQSIDVKLKINENSQSPTMINVGAQDSNKPPKGFLSPIFSTKLTINHIKFRA